jgi:hypothetical protein
MYVVASFVALSASAAIGEAPFDAGRQTVTMILEQPEVVRISSTKYLVKCHSGRTYKLTLEESNESFAAGPMNAYVPGQVWWLCNASLARGK